MKETEENLQSPFRDIFSFNNNEYIEVGFQGDIDKVSNIFVSCYDAGMKQQHTNQVAELAGKRYRTGFAFDNRLIAIVSDDDEKVTAQEINCKTGALVGASVDLFQMTGKRRNSVYRGSSASGNYHCFASLGKKVSDYSETFTGVVIDKQMKVISRFKHIVPPKLKIFLDVYIMLSDEGELTFIYSGYFFKSFSLIPPVYTVIRVDKGGNMKEGKITDLPEGDFWSPDFHVKGNMIEFAALQRLKNREGYHTLVTGELDPVQQKLTKVKETKLMDHLIVPGYYKEKFKKEYIPYPGMLTVRYMHKDGSRTLVYENKSDGPIAKKVGETHYISYFAAHVYVMRLNAANELQWMQVIGKDQFESNTDMHVGAASFMDDKENIHLVFYDHNKNTAPEPVKKPEYQDPVSDKIGLASVQITSDGKMTKTFITDKKESKWHFVPKHVYAFRSNEMVFLSINEKGGSLLGNQKGVYTKSGWHLGIIRLQ